MNRLYDDLIAYGYRVRKYDLDMVDNRPIQSALLAIRDAGYFVAILTPTSVESTFLREYSSLLQELETDQTLVVPLLYESCAIPEVLSPKPYIDFTESYGRGLDQLRKTLHETKLLPSSIVTISASGARLADTTAKLTAALTGSQNLYLAVDVGGTKAYIALMTSDGERLFNRKYSTRSYRDETALLEFMVWSIKDTISGIHNASRRPTVDVEEKISAIGIAFAGPTDSANGIVRAAPNLDIKTDFPLATALSQALEGKPVYVGNDADLGVLGETWKGAARSYKNIIGIIIGTGIGGGIVVDGQLYGGATSAAGEIGHMVVDLDSKYQCGCKQYGCFEVLASRQAMARELHRRKAMKR